MSKSYVIHALRLFNFEEMLKLAQAKWTKTALKKAAGEELVVWDDNPSDSKDKHQSDALSNVLPIKKGSVPAREAEPLRDPDLAGPNQEQVNSDFMSTELLLWQREFSRDNGSTRSKNEAFKGYGKSTEVIMVKTTDLDGKEKIRFASTQGVLVNKKQA